MPRRVQDDDVFSLARDVVVETSEQDVTLLDTRRGVYWKGNGTTGLVLDSLGSGTRLDETAQAIADRYDVEYPVVHQDVTRIVQELLKARLVVRAAVRSGR